MPYIRLQQPLRGFTDQVSYRSQAGDYTKKCLNVMPFDVFERRLRIGTRQGFCALADFADGSAGTKIQGMLPYKVYRAGVLTQRILIIQNGKVFDCNESGSSRLEIAQTTTAITFGNGSSQIAAAYVPATALSATNDVQLVQFRNYAYLIDGKDYYQIDLSKQHAASSHRIGIEHWAELNDASPQVAIGAGVSGARTQDATIIAVWGARVVLAGFQTTPNVWQASHAGDPSNWQAASTAAGGIAGGNSPQYATLGDQITAIVPFGSSGLLLACRDSMSYMTTDPVFGTNATLEAMSREVGCLGVKAVTPGPEKSAFVIGSDGVYQVRPNDFDINRGDRISSGALDALFSRTDPSDLGTPMVVYDEGKQVLNVFLSRPLETELSLHATYDIATQSWWPFVIADSKNNNPTSNAVFKPLNKARQTIWYGGPQGRISVQPALGVFEKDGQKVTAASGGWAVTENLTSFDCRVLIGPLNDDASQRLLLRDVRVILQDNSVVENAGDNTSFSSLSLPTTAQVLSGSPYPSSVTSSFTTTQTSYARTITEDIAQLDIFDIDSVQQTDVTNESLTMVSGILSMNDDATGASTSYDQVPDPLDTGETLIDGGVHNTTYGATARLLGGFGHTPDGLYLRQSGEGVEVYYGPQQWVFYKDQSTNKYKVSYGGNVLFESDAASSIPNKIFDVDLSDSILTSSVLPTNFVVNEPPTALATKSLDNSRNNAIRVRLRSADFFFQISSEGRSWAIEDISVDIAPGGPYRKVLS